MSRSTRLLNEILDGDTLVAITEIAKHEDRLRVRFSSGENLQRDQIYDFTSKEFIKMCKDADAIDKNYIIHNTESLGKRLWITIDGGMIANTAAYSEHQEGPVKDKASIIAEQREMIAQVEGKDPFDI